MNYVADSAIRGFYYQFIKTLEVIIDLPSSDGIVTPEGIFEDIDVCIAGDFIGIQCKYHEGHKGYGDSFFYSALLEIMFNFHTARSNNISYILYIYYQNAVQSHADQIDAPFIKKMLKSQNQELIVKYICKLSKVDDHKIASLIDKNRKSPGDKKAIVDYFKTHDASLLCNVDIDDFLNSVTVLIGESCENLEKRVKQKMQHWEMTSSEVENIFFPNAIHEISQKSQRKLQEERQIIKVDFIERLKNNKRILLTKWTRLLREHKALFKEVKSQLKAALNIPTRKRYFIVEPLNIDNLIPSLCNFIKEYLDIYKRKPIQRSFPMFFINHNDAENITCSVEQLLLNDYGIRVNTGRVGPIVDARALFPQTSYAPDMKLGLCAANDSVESMIRDNPPDDLFIIGRGVRFSFEGVSFNVEKLNIDTYDELKYLFDIRKAL
jgi:hypothetical protein